MSGTGTLEEPVAGDAIVDFVTVRGVEVSFTRMVCVCVCGMLYQV